MSRPQSKYVRVDATNPTAAAQCDRCGRWFNRTDLVWQTAWAGTHLYSIQLLVCTTGDCFDTPQEQLRTIILPPDPPPVLNARVPNFAYEEKTDRIFQGKSLSGNQVIRCLQGGQIARILQYNTSS